MLKQPLPTTTRWLGGSLLVALLTLGAGATAWSAQPGIIASQPMRTSDIPAGKIAVEAYWPNGGAKPR